MRTISPSLRSESPTCSYWASAPQPLCANSLTPADAGMPEAGTKPSSRGGLCPNDFRSPAACWRDTVRRKFPSENSTLSGTARGIRHSSGICSAIASSPRTAAGNGIPTLPPPSVSPAPSAPDSWKPGPAASSPIAARSWKWSRPRRSRYRRR